MPADAPPPALTAEPFDRIPPAAHLASLISDLLAQGTEGDETPRCVIQARSRQAARVVATFCSPAALAGLEDARRLEDARWALLTIMSTPLDDSAPPAEAGESAAADHYRQAAYAMARAASGALDAASQPGTGEAQDAD